MNIVCSIQSMSPLFICSTQVQLQMSMSVGYVIIPKYRCQKELIDLDDQRQDLSDQRKDLGDRREDLGEHKKDFGD